MTDFTEEEGKKLLDTNKALGVKRKADSTDDLQTWMFGHLQAQGKLQADVQSESDDGNGNEGEAGPAGVTGTNAVSTQWPRLPTFSGDENSKTDVSFDIWKYEVVGLLEDKLQPEETIRQAIRRSLRAQAARAAGNVGLKADSRAILRKLEAVFGMVQVGQTLISEFYAASQKKGEDAASWGCRLEDMITRMQDQGLIGEKDVNEMLRAQFWTNLDQKLKDSSRHKYDTIKDFDMLRREIRMIEREHKVSAGREADAGKARKILGQCATEASDDSSDNNSARELRGIVHKLCNQVESIQQDIKSLRQGQQSTRPPYAKYSVWPGSATGARPMTAG